MEQMEMFYLLTIREFKNKRIKYEKEIVLDDNSVIHVITHCDTCKLQ